jgi:hypothetical protein
LCGKAFCVLLEVLEINIFSGHIPACWMSAEDEELERLRQQRMAELQSRAAEEQAGGRGRWREPLSCVWF